MLHVEAAFHLNRTIFIHVKIIRIQLPDDLVGKYTHRDYLGALLNLGVLRNKIGDIIVNDDIPLYGELINSAVYVNSGGFNIDGKKVTKFACVDGPDFNGYEVDFDEAMSRGKMYGEFERHAYEEACNLFKGVK